MTNRVIWCLVENDRTPFRITAAAGAIIDDLKKLIKAENEGTLRGIDAKNLKLLMLRKPIPIRPSRSIAERVSTLKSSSSDFANVLDELTDNVSTTFPEHLSEDCLYILVVLPAPVEVPDQITQSLSETTLSESAFNKLVDGQLSLLRDKVRAFLKNPEPPAWIPPLYGSPRDREFLSNLKIPAYMNGNPSLLFHNLLNCDEHAIQEIFGGHEHLLICNTSGSGKTRRMLEAFAKRWAFYFVASPDSNGVGVQDLRNALLEMSMYKQWESDLMVLPPDERIGQDVKNIRIATRCLKEVLAARVVVFELFLQVAIEEDGQLQDKHKHSWLLFQLLEDPYGDLHPFRQMMQKCMSRAPLVALQTTVSRLHDIREKYLDSYVMIGLDEAQWATRLYPRAFLSSTNRDIYRSPIREFTKVVAQLNVRLVVSGTGLSQDEVEDALASGVSKPNKVRLVHGLGMFDTWPKLQPFLEYYVTASFFSTPSGRRLEVRIREYLLGRYRFSVSFLEYFLRNGLQSPHKLLNAYIKEHTSCLPGDIGNPFVSQEPELRVTLQMVGFEWDRLMNDKLALRSAAELVQSHLTRGIRPTYGVHLKVVEYGIARLYDRHEGRIVEPLAFLSLMRWLEDTPDLGIHVNIGAPLSSQNSRGNAYEELVILYLHRILQYQMPFSTIFNFHKSTPWADEIAQMVARLDYEDVAMDVLGETPMNPALGSVYYAATMEDIISWCETLSTTSPVLVSDDNFGPDVLVRLEDVIFMGQLKSRTKGNKYTLDAKTMTEALTSLHPDHWFKNFTTKPHLRQKLKDTIGRFRVLRFVAGYPLPPNFDLQANSVKRALEALGPTVILATLNVDTFRGHFISENQARNVLDPMDLALACKR